MEKDFDKGQEIVFSKKIKAGKRRTYFFDVRRTKGEDFYLTLSEVTKRFNADGVTRHKIFLYKEDFNRFIEGLNEAIDHVKSDLLPDYDYEQFDRKHEEWNTENQQNESSEETQSLPSKEKEKEITDIDEDLNW